MLFVVDGAGALLSAFLLGVVLVRFNTFFGIPVGVLYFLAVLPCLFALYDLVCVAGRLFHNPAYLKAIAVMNLLYCVLSVTLLVYHYHSVTAWGVLYVVQETALVLTLASLEYKVAVRLVA